MLRNYARLFARHLARQKGYAFINVAGLGVGMAAFVIITLFIVGELAYDQHHPHGDQIYQVQLDAAVMEQELITASAPAVMAQAFIDEFPEIIDATRINGPSRLLVANGERRFYEEGYFQADSSVFDFFTLPLVQGEEATALNRPYTILLSEATAQKYFGDVNPVGQTLRIDNRRDYEVTGVFRKDPRNAHFAPDLVASFLSNPRWDDTMWLNNSFMTYVRLAEGADVAALQAKMPAAVQKFVGGEVEQFLGQPLEAARANGFRYDWVLQPLPTLYLHNTADDQIGRAGDIRYVYLLGVIALFVLLIACINFMNLATARATGRAREVGLRKVLGSERPQLVRQFLMESVLTAGLGMGVATGLVVLALPAFNEIADVQLGFAPWVAVAMVGIAVATGLLAGVYPAFVLSRFQPVVVLKGSFARSTKGQWLRSGLVVGQFVISITLIIGTLVVFQQMQFLQDRDLGFAADQVVVLPIETAEGRRSFPTFRSEILTHPNVIDAAASGILPGDHIHNTTGFRSEDMPQDQVMIAAFGEVTDDYVETLGLEIVAGRDFDEAYATDAEGWLLNEAAAREMGYTPEEAVGRRVMRPFGGPDNTDRWGTVVGVLADAHYESLHREIRPVIFGHADQNQFYLPVRVAPEQLTETLAFLEAKWTAFQPGFPFRYYFMDDDFQEQYAQEARLSQVFTLFASLAILIACLGLFGLASFVTTARTKEIGVRKVLGASVTSIVGLLTKEFTLLVGVACVLAFPLGYFAMSRWLDAFAYAVPLSAWVFVGAGMAALLIAWLTVAYQSIRAATADPVRALRYE